MEIQNIYLQKARKYALISVALSLVCFLLAILNIALSILDQSYFYLVFVNAFPLLVPIIAYVIYMNCGYVMTDYSLNLKISLFSCVLLFYIIGAGIADVVLFIQDEDVGRKQNLEFGIILINAGQITILVIMLYCFFKANEYRNYWYFNVDDMSKKHGINSSRIMRSSSLSQPNRNSTSKYSIDIPLYNPLSIGQEI